MALCRAVTGKINVYCFIQMLAEKVELFIFSLLTLKRSWGEKEEVFFKKALKEKLSDDRFITPA